MFQGVMGIETSCSAIGRSVEQLLKRSCFGFETKINHKFIGIMFALSMQHCQKLNECFPLTLKNYWW